MTRRASIVIMISGRGSNMAALIDACADNILPATIALVISDRADAGGLAIARSAGIASVAIEARNYKNKAAHEAEILSQLANIQPDLICLAGYMRILSADFVDQYAGRILNIHPSLLPKYPGLNTHARALEAGDKEHGCTVHYVDAQMDQGPVICQQKVPVDGNDNESSLAEKVLKVEHALYIDAVGIVLAKGGKMSM